MQEPKHIDASDEQEFLNHEAIQTFRCDSRRREIFLKRYCKSSKELKAGEIFKDFIDENEALEDDHPKKLEDPKKAITNQLTKIFKELKDIPGAP